MSDRGRKREEGRGRERDRERERSFIRCPFKNRPTMNSAARGKAGVGEKSGEGCEGRERMN